MPIIKANKIDIEYEESGPKKGPPVLMIMGLAGQLTFWPPAMIKGLNKAGFRTIRFDNRDIGKSHKFHKKSPPNPLVQLLTSRFGVRGLAPYSLIDMAKDTAGLLDTLEIPRAHVIGVSMGGMIGQVLSAKYPDRVASFTAIMSSTNNPKLPRATGDVAKALLSPPKPAATKEEALERSMYVWSLIGTKDSGSTDDELRARLAASYERSNYPAGTAPSAGGDY